MIPVDGNLCVAALLAAPFSLPTRTVVSRTRRRRKRTPLRERGDRAGSEATPVKRAVTRPLRVFLLYAQRDCHDL